MTDLLRLCRLYYAIPMSLAYLLTVVYALGGRPGSYWAGTLLSTLALALVIAAGYVFNDVCDGHVDRINAPHRPIAAGRIQPRAALSWAGGLMLLGLAVAAQCRLQFLAVLGVVAAGLISYDLFSKRLGMGKPLLVAVLMTSIYPLALAEAGGAAGTRATTLAVFPLWMLLTTFGYEVLKDIRDTIGDRSATAVPSWIQRQPRRARRLAVTTILLGAMLLIGPRLAGCGNIYMSIVTVAMLLAAAAVLPRTRLAMACIYLEFVVVGIAATADVLTSAV